VCLFIPYLYSHTQRKGFDRSLTRTPTSDVQGTYYGQVSATDGFFAIGTDVINVIPNVPYTFSFWARGNCGLFWGVDDGNILFDDGPGDLDNDSVWVQRELVFTPDVSPIGLVLGCGGQQGPQILRLDAVSLVPTTGCPFPVGF
jgi:hypothetical protein